MTEDGIGGMGRGVPQDGGFELQAEVLGRIAARILMIAPWCWNQVVVGYTKIGDNDYGGCEGKAYILGHAPVPYPWGMAKDLSDLFAYLKQVMAHPEKGTWLDVEYTITFPDRYSVEYSYGKDDAFEPLPDPSDLRRELQLYPRASKYIPEWFRKAVEEG